jgi:hypothetical protein
MDAGREADLSFSEELLSPHTTPRHCYEGEDLNSQYLSSAASAHHHHHHHGRRGGDEGGFDSGNFSENLDSSGGDPGGSPPFPIFAIGSPSLRGGTIKSRSLERSLGAQKPELNVSVIPTFSTPELSARAHTVSSPPAADIVSSARSDSYLHNLVNNFNTAYEQKLAAAETSTRDGEGDREVGVVRQG